MAVVVACLVTTAALGAEPASASTPTIERHIDAVDDFVRKGGVPQPPTVPAEQLERIRVADDLWMAEHRPMPNQPASKAMHRELWKLRARARLLPAAGTFLRAAGTAGLALTSFQVGWKVGTGIRSLFVTPTPPPLPGEGESINERLVACGVPNGFCDGMLQEVTDESNHYFWDPQREGDPSDIQALLVWDSDVGGTHTNIQTARVWEEDECYASGQGVRPPRFPTGGLALARTVPWMTIANCFYDPGPGWVVRRDARYHDQSYFYDSSVVDVSDVKPYSGQIPGHTTETWPGLDSDSDADRSARIRAELREHPDDYPNLIPWIDAHLGGDEQDPTGQVARMPACDGLTVTDCQGFVEAATGRDMTMVATEVAPDGMRLDLPAGAIVTTTPAPGELILDTTTEIHVKTNPPAERMPVAIPKPAPHERGGAYIERVRQRGLNPVREVLAEPDPAFGPDEVVRTWPRPTPDGSTNAADYAPPGSDVKVFVNADSAPDPVPDPGGGGECEPWVRPDIDLSPLNVPVGTTFPFGLLTWTADVVESWVVDVEAPKVTMPFPYTEDGVTIDLRSWDSVMPLVRSMLLATSLIALVWWLATAILGLGGDKPRED